MTELLQTLINKSRTYVTTIEDCGRIQNINIDVIDVLKKLKKFATQVIDQCSRILPYVTQIYQNFENASVQQVDQAIQISSQILHENPEVVQQKIAKYIELTGIKGEEIDYDYERAIERHERSSWTNNVDRLRERGLWTNLSELYTKANKLDEIGDIRNLLDRNQRELETLSQYLSRKDMGLVVFDLLFNPRVTLRYASRVVQLLALQDLSLEDMSRTFEWIRLNSLELIKESSQEYDRLYNEIDRLKSVRKSIVQTRENVMAEEESQKQQYQTLLKERSELMARRKELDRAQLLLQAGLRYLGDSNRITEYYSTLEEQYLRNILTNIHEIDTETLDITDDISAIERFSSHVDTKPITDLTSNYANYRQILYNWLKEATK